MVILYYGSTAQKDLSSRLTGHIKDYRYYMMYEDQSYITSFKS